MSVVINTRKGKPKIPKCLAVLKTETSPSTNVLYTTKIEAAPKEVKTNCGENLLHSTAIYI